MQSLKSAMIPTGKGRVIRAFGDEAVFHLEGSHTGGQFAMFTNTTMPGGGPPPHSHANEDEWWLVLEGRASFLIDGKWIEVNAGDTVFAPRGSIHTFKNVGDKPLKQLIHVSPAGFETFFSRCEQVFAIPGKPDMEKIIAISREHGIEYHQ